MPSLKPLKELVKIYLNTKEGKGVGERKRNSLFPVPQDRSSRWIGPARPGKGSRGAGAGVSAGRRNCPVRDVKRAKVTVPFPEVASWGGASPESRVRRVPAPRGGWQDGGDMWGASTLCPAGLCFSLGDPELGTIDCLVFVHNL